MRYRAAFLLVVGATAISAQAVSPTFKPPPKTAAVTAPRFEVDMLWPKPMPNRWIMGSVTGLAIDARDHIYVLNTGEYFTARTEIGGIPNPAPQSGECCVPVPPVVEYDALGALVGHWGGPGEGYEWPTSASGLGI